jgi:nitroreductase
MKLLDEIEKRRSGRAYADTPVPDELLELILEAGRRAPSCANTQAWNFVVIKNPETRDAANESLSGGNYWAKKAPVMVVVVTSPDGGCKAHNLPYFMMDIGLSVQSMLLQAVHLGLMGHPTAGWNEEKLKEILNIPEDFRIGTVVFFGYEGSVDHLSDKHKESETRRSSRKSIEEIVHWDTW